MEPLELTASKRRVGFYNDFGVIEECAWAMKNMQILPDEGGFLEQDTSLMKDIRLYWWWYNLALNKLKSEKLQSDKMRKKRA